MKPRLSLLRLQVPGVTLVLAMFGCTGSLTGGDGMIGNVESVDFRLLMKVGKLTLSGGS